MAAEDTQRKIKERIFFKRDGKTLYDGLLKPLNLSAKHIIIVPDKHLWKIPFHALSSDGNKYLIEDTTVSYAPAVSVLIDQLKTMKPNRRSLLAFANSTFNGRNLKFVNIEARAVSGLFSTNPILNATEKDFKLGAGRSDILHFSMHAEVNSDDPLSSFLAFRPVGNSDGKLSVEELLGLKLKKGSLAFLASYDTDTVLNGEGVVSLAWGLMGSGATTVISAQWEADDRSTEVFSNHFYTAYRRANSASESMRIAALAMIRDKSGGFHEPYYWAAFILHGDFR